MNLNIHILFDELKDSSPQITTFKDIDLNLRQIRIPEVLDCAYQKEYIYILEASVIEEHAQLLHDIDLISIGYMDSQNAKKLNLSVISLPDNCNKATIFNRVQDIFEKYKQWDYDLMKSIATKEPLQIICDKAATILDNPFALLDITLKFILKCGTLPEDYRGTIWEVVMEEEYTPSETFSLSTDDLYFFLPHNTKPYFVHGAPYKQYSHLISNVYQDGKLFAFIATTDTNAPLSQGQISLIKHIRDVMELAISSSVELKGSEEDIVYYLEKLIKGFSVDEKILSYHLTKRGWRLYDNFRMYTISNPDGKEFSDSQLKFCLYRIKKIKEDVICFSYENFISVIIRESKSDENKEYPDLLMGLISKLGLNCGYSHIFYRFIDLQCYYIQSKAALAEGEKKNPESNLWNFSDYYFLHLISLVSNMTNIKSMCHSNILRLREYDNTYGTDFVQCLRIYLYNGCNIAQTGNELFMHRNTLTYRLEKIKEIIGMDARQMQENERMQLWFSCLICSYL